MKSPTTKDWSELVIHATKKETQAAVKDPKWQLVRQNLVGTSLWYKYTHLVLYLYWTEDDVGFRQRQIQVSNYVNALKRGGQIKTS